MIMLYINQTTTKKEFLELLTQQASYSGELEIFVTKLPVFLNTSVAFTVFSYQISNYPRDILWITEQDEIKSYLENCGAKVRLNYQSKDFQSHSNKVEPNIIGTNLLLSTENNKPLKEQREYTLPTFNNLSPEGHRNQLNSHSLLENERYHPSALLDEQENITESESKNIENAEGFQNLDMWLKRIESTKIALDDMKSRQDPPQQSQIQNTQNNKDSVEFFKNTYQKSKPTSKLAKILLSSAVFSFLFVSFLILFPSKAYTIDLQQTSVEDGTTLSLNRQNFSKKTVNMKAESTVQASGQKEVLTDRSFGKISLINNGSKEVDLNNGLFRLIKDNKEYQAIPNSTLPKSFSIPPRNGNNGQNLEFNIQSSLPGSEYNLSENTKLEIVNFLDQKVCSNCYAITTTEIKNTTLSGDKIVTEADNSLLRNNVESILTQKRDLELDSMKSEDILTNPNWFKNIDSKYIFNNNIGDVALNLNLQAEVTTEIYYMNKNNIFDILKSQNQEIQSITEFDIVENSGSFNDKDEIQLKIFYRYIRESTCYNFNRDKFKDTLSQKSFDYAKVDLQKTCPEIRDVEKKELGLNMPGVPARVDIIVRNN